MDSCELNLSEASGHLRRGFEARRVPHFSLCMSADLSQPRFDKPLAALGREQWTITLPTVHSCSHYTDTAVTHGFHQLHHFPRLPEERKKVRRSNSTILVRFSAQLKPFGFSQALHDMAHPDVSSFQMARKRPSMGDVMMVQWVDEKDEHLQLSQYGAVTVQLVDKPDGTVTVQWVDEPDGTVTVQWVDEPDGTVTVQWVDEPDSCYFQWYARRRSSTTVRGRMNLTHMVLLTPVGRSMVLTLVPASQYLGPSTLPRSIHVMVSFNPLSSYRGWHHLDGEFSRFLFDDAIYNVCADTTNWCINIVPSLRLRSDGMIAHSLERRPRFEVRARRRRLMPATHGHLHKYSAVRTYTLFSISIGFGHASNRIMGLLVKMQPTPRI
ncbi:hypothetical protein BKA70DRAFT_1218481 [Coprinopsis sp. MPI-PUGE-AT-0042]|nr:hypothetical protein BKA70DRAFT_1218481 [Coprinopsis sp. MPI-PUGE-AT-0042]